MDCEKGRHWKCFPATCKVTGKHLRWLYFRKPPQDALYFYRLRPKNKKPLQFALQRLEYLSYLSGNYLPDMTPWSLKVRVGTNSPNL